MYNLGNSLFLHEAPDSATRSPCARHLQEVFFSQLHSAECKDSNPMRDPFANSVILDELLSQSVLVFAEKTKE